MNWHSQWVDEHQIAVMHWHSPPPHVSTTHSLMTAFALPPAYGDIFVEDFNIGVFGGATIMRCDSYVLPTKLWHIGNKCHGPGLAITTREVNLPGIPSCAASRFWLCDTPQRALRILRSLTAGVPPGEHVCIDKLAEVDIGGGHKRHVNHRIVGRPRVLGFTPPAEFRWRDELVDLREEALLYGLKVRAEPLCAEDHRKLWFAGIAGEVERLIAADDDYRREEWRLHLRAMIDCELLVKG